MCPVGRSGLDRLVVWLKRWGTQRLRAGGQVLVSSWLHHPPRVITSYWNISPDIHVFDGETCKRDGPLGSNSGKTRGKKTERGTYGYTWNEQERKGVRPSYRDADGYISGTLRDSIAVLCLTLTFIMTWYNLIGSNTVRLTFLITAASFTGFQNKFIFHSSHFTLLISQLSLKS